MNGPGAMVPPAPSGTRQQAWRGRVTRISGGKPYVEIPRRTPGFEYGPCDIVEGVWTPSVATDATTVGDLGSHAHTFPRPLTTGDRVLVVFLAPDDPVVVGRLV